MPLYEYECPECGVFEQRNTVEKRGEAYCPNCGRLSEKKMSVVNFTFGWRLADECHYVKGTPDKFIRDI